MKVTVKIPKNEARKLKFEDMPLGQAYTNGNYSFIKLGYNSFLDDEGSLCLRDSYPKEKEYTLLPARTIFEIESN